MKNGKLIVIEGVDGSGKATQTAMLAEYLKRKNIKCEIVDFPQYDNFSSAFVSKYLRGEYGKADEVGPYKASIFYALDRYDKSFEIKKWIKEGKLVISNRYVSASMGHQTGKIKDKKSRDKFLEWLSNLEYKIFDIPKPDKTFFLYLDPKIGQKLVLKKPKRDYIKGKKRDIHEADLSHLNKALEAYLYVAKKYKWVTIDCAPNGNLRSRDHIHNEVVKKLNSVIGNYKK